MLAGIVPAKGLANAKTRLRLPASALLKEKLLLAMLDAVLEAMNESRLDTVYVVSSDSLILEHSQRMGARPVEEPAPMGINAAVSLANRHAIHDGAKATLVITSDVGLITAGDVDSMVGRGLQRGRCVVASPSMRGGTNGLWRAPPDVIPNRYGENSFIKHQQECKRAGIPFFQFDCDRLSLDVDTLEDLVLLVQRDRASRRYAFLSGILEEERRVQNGCEEG